jgi:hypothetical protein
LWAQGNTEAAIQVEKLSNQLAKTYNVDILCGYSLGAFRAGWTATSSNESVQIIQPFIPTERARVFGEGGDAAIPTLRPEQNRCLK